MPQISHIHKTCNFKSSSVAKAFPAAHPEGQNEEENK